MHPKLGHLLDTNEIDFSIMQIFEELIRSSNTQLEAGNVYANYEILHSPMFEALFDCNIIWKSKYYSYICVEHYFYISCMQDWVEQRCKAMNSYEHALYYLFKKQKGVRLGKQMDGVGPRN